ncbi:hypothetical protein [Rhizobium sp. SL86]|uniref:hypothetical protein n=1 Tax=Rhizobium sp. SL86 TaxID=2995148 RepID=UPI0022760822|nr:hypothetical protein [Rhizobium sp. SL86]MCY1669394.1 hypothetical protein [Rhizobium sp. SL86]
MASQRLFFFHNPKAAGSSIIDSIGSLWPHLHRAPHIAHTIQENVRTGGDYNRFKGYDLYIGHYSREVFDAVNNGHAYITNFRYPVARVLSLYNYFRNGPPPQKRFTQDEIIDFYCVDAAKTMDFGEFARSRDPRILIYTNDAHFRQLTSSQWVLDAPATNIDNACAFIDDALCFYVCEYPDLSAAWFRERLGLTEIAERNVTRNAFGYVGIEEVDDASYEAILEINQRDLAIYRHAVKRLLERGIFT